MSKTTKHIERAEKEAGRKNYDLAISLFDQVLSIEPNSGRARAGKRRAELKKFAKSYPSALTRSLKNLGPLVGMAFGRMVRAHGMVVNLAEKACGNDPQNVKLNLALGQALLRAGHHDGAEAAFAVVTEFDQNDIRSLKILGRLYYDAKKWDNALECYERVIKISPRDQEAVKMRKNLAAEGAIKSGGFEGASSGRDVAKSKAQMEHLEKRQRLVKTEDDLEEEVASLENEVAENPDDAAAHLRLGNVLYQKRDLARAADSFEKVLALVPDDTETATRLGDVRLLDFDTKIREAKQNAKDDIEGAEDRLRRMIRERRAFRIGEFERRVKVHPTDAGLRFKLGGYLLDDDRVDEAIAELQTSVKDPRRKTKSMTLLGRAFMKKGLWDLAIKQLSGALEELGGVNEKSLSVVYTLGQAHEQHESYAEALDHYMKIYEIDISFRDVNDKIETLKGRIAT